MIKENVTISFDLTNGDEELEAKSVCLIIIRVRRFHMNESSLKWVFNSSGIDYDLLTVAIKELLSKSSQVH